MRAELERASRATARSCARGDRASRSRRRRAARRADRRRRSLAPCAAFARALAGAALCRVAARLDRLELRRARLELAELARAAARARRAALALARSGSSPEVAQRLADAARDAAVELALEPRGAARRAPCASPSAREALARRRCGDADLRRRADPRGARATLRSSESWASAATAARRAARRMAVARALEDVRHGAPRRAARARPSIAPARITSAHDARSSTASSVASARGLARARRARARPRPRRGSSRRFCATLREQRRGLGRSETRRAPRRRRGAPWGARVDVARSSASNAAVVRGSCRARARPRRAPSSLRRRSRARSPSARDRRRIVALRRALAPRASAQPRASARRRAARGACRPAPRRCTLADDAQARDRTRRSAAARASGTTSVSLSVVDHFSCRATLPLLRRRRRPRAGTRRRGTSPLFCVCFTRP